ncbi:WD40 repeat-like protein [Polyporus arcularius HHB13444]|uniref:WD40 repeat-like protein n=1 Tax=Polyporus arcularius HHB13444 TaxID=1314778 RepID=A0A5C3NTF4_9APHY|nr:WD40 repeat-like protein [Polyporus arcularius HHB13444]
MALRYEETARLQRGLDGGVSALAFSPDGTYIAAAGMEDPKVYVWRVADHKLLHTYTGSRCPFLALEWLPGRSDTILCGSSDGYIAVLRLGSQELAEATGFWAHDYPVERLATQGSQLVSGAQPEVRVWQHLSNGTNVWRHVTDLQGPPKDSKNAEEQFIVMGIHWTKTRVHRLVVVVTYMHHGIVARDVLSHVCLMFSLYRGGSSVSPKGSIIALSVMGFGFNLYHLDKGDCIASFVDDTNGERTVPVLLVHGGLALFGGSTVGRAALWNVQNQRIHQTFAPKPYDTILAIAANYNAEQDRFLLATGGNDAHGKSAVVIWMAREYMWLSEAHAHIQSRRRVRCSLQPPIPVAAR